ncbi:MAG: sugar phosphate nucleotidyltransferase [Candidatus Omnitrophica bacterium]|nr:sugar phosphate nucleotidyltransferase [Candidatus Omnitrophota bacterium]
MIERSNQESIEKLKGVILAGGLGSRLEPLTRIINKHLLPIWNKPMICYPLMTLVEAGIKDIMIVTGGNNAGDFLKLLGNGKEFGLKHLYYTYQKEEKGIADALSYAEDFAKDSRIVVILGDNIIEEPIKKYIKRFLKQPKGARILIKKVDNPQRFGVLQLKGKKIISIEEKPKKPKSNYIVTGIYMYDKDVFDIIKNLKPSRRNELEITDVNNVYLNNGLLEYDILDGFWTDCGTFESLLRANNLIADKYYKKR